MSNRKDSQKLVFGIITILILGSLGLFSIFSSLDFGTVGKKCKGSFDFDENVANNIGSDNSPTTTDGKNSRAFVRINVKSITPGSQVDSVKLCLGQVFNVNVLDCDSVDLVIQGLDSSVDMTPNTDLERATLYDAMGIGPYYGEINGLTEANDGTGGKCIDLNARGLTDLKNSFGDYFYISLSASEACPGRDCNLDLYSETGSPPPFYLDFTPSTICNAQSDTNCDGIVSSSELIVYTNLWVSGSVTFGNLMIAANSWADS